MSASSLFLVMSWAGMGHRAYVVIGLIWAQIDLDVFGQCRMGRDMIGRLLLCLALIQAIRAQLLLPESKWLTLNGAQPEIVAEGGYSGFFPDSSQPAYDFALDYSLPGTILYCNVHFTKDGEGFCVDQINLQNATNIQDIDPKGAKTYNINGQDINGWFGLDYLAKTIFETATLRQNIFTRMGVFDGAPILGPPQLFVDKNGKPTRVWLNIEYDAFYNQHKISPEAYLLQRLEQLPEFISSSEVGFLKSIGLKLGKSKTKLIFKFLEADALEPATNEKYSSLITKLPMIKSFASGILVPKEYIWPVNKARVLQPATSLVQEAHKHGLTVYASGFANDNMLSYNYSYDPAREYRQFTDNSQFSVDGVLSEFPSTASEALACLPRSKNASRVLQTLVISHNGASGDFPGSTDLAYQKAIEDGADIIDCSVQMSKDGIAFCSDRSDLLKTTTAATLFMDLATNIPEIQKADGIFSFDLTWEEIQSLKPQIESFFENELVRNPANRNSGKFVTLSEFLELAKTKAPVGVLISIRNAAYLASTKSLNIVDTVSESLANASYDKQSTQKVLIQSDDTSVLSKFKDIPSYQRVLYLEQSIGGAPREVAQEVKKYADAVFVHRDAIVVAADNFAENMTRTVPELHAANVSVYVGYFKNEFENLIFDYLSDPYVELATMFAQNVDGFVTDFPATANAFVRSSCAGKRSPYVIQAAKPGFLFETAPAAEPPVLSVADVVDPPLPSLPTVNSEAPPSDESASSPMTTPSQASKSSSTCIKAGVGAMIGAAIAVCLV